MVRLARFRPVTHTATHHPQRSFKHNRMQHTIPNVAARTIFNLERFPRVACMRPSLKRVMFFLSCGSRMQGGGLAPHVLFAERICGPQQSRALVVTAQDDWPQEEPQECLQQRRLSTLLLTPVEHVRLHMLQSEHLTPLPKPHTSSRVHVLLPSPSTPDTPHSCFPSFPSHQGSHRLSHCGHALHLPEL